MKKYTLQLFIFSFVMSLISLVIMEKGYKELYPFFSWKLFTVPSGGEATEDQYKLYGITDSDTIRIVNKSVRSYDANDKAVIVGTYGKRIEDNVNKEENKRKLLIFAKDTEPQYKGYLLYKETYRPKEIGEAKMNINKKLIVKL
ncbi:hypothetical protein RAH57_18000 [Chryseobacterium sp. CKR4-1]|uniref:hypothetical protein n=1 Tax=Chryseobacterium sp. CKR4-1 TaxID=3068896 RepID=UPI0027967831|nr:hypothetical protein [Chryseobacterium sp. CKR4-1]MDQ1805891.1 hypothetical protein [Chryseobacterium sp. CKR4-1]